jgi:2-polyprenyl-6-methoxyphenol hydroxylase-like FAD-dependent oxidoreductase
MSNVRILVSGASIAGPAAAHWLRRRGAEVTVVEHGPALVGAYLLPDYAGLTDLRAPARVAEA